MSEMSEMSELNVKRPRQTGQTERSLSNKRRRRTRCEQTLCIYKKRRHGNTRQPLFTCSQCHLPPPFYMCEPFRIDRHQTPAYETNQTYSLAQDTSPVPKCRFVKISKFTNFNPLTNLADFTDKGFLNRSHQGLQIPIPESFVPKTEEDFCYACGSYICGCRRHIPALYPEFERPLAGSYTPFKIRPSEPFGETAEFRRPDRSFESSYLSLPPPQLKEN